MGCDYRHGAPTELGKPLRGVRTQIPLVTDKVWTGACIPVGSASQTRAPRRVSLTPWPPLPRTGEGGFPSLSRSALRVRPGHPAPGSLTPWPPLPRTGEGGFPSLSRCRLRVGRGHPVPGVPHPLAPSPSDGRGGNSLVFPGLLCESDLGTRRQTVCVHTLSLRGT